MDTNYMLSTMQLASYSAIQVYIQTICCLQCN